MAIVPNFIVFQFTISNAWLKSQQLYLQSEILAIKYRFDRFIDRTGCGFSFPIFMLQRIKEFTFLKETAKTRRYYLNLKKKIPPPIFNLLFVK